MTVITRSIKFVLLLSGCLLFSASAWSAAVSAPAPDFTLKQLDGKNLKLSELAGNVVLINFWASWCGPCVKEMPLLNKIHNKYNPLGFTVLGVNVEQNSDNARDFLAGNGVDFPILLDSKNQVTQQYEVIAMPTTVLVDRDGKIRFIHKGYKSGDEAQYRKMVKQLVRE